MTEIAASVPPTWMETEEYEWKSAQLIGRKNDANQQQAELKEMIAHHKQFNEAVMRTEVMMEEMEDKLGNDLNDIELLKGKLLEVIRMHPQVAVVTLRFPCVPVHTYERF